MKKIKVLYEDANILAIDKPSGISVHPAVEQAHYGASPKSKKKESFVTDWVLKNYPKMKNVGEPMGEIARPGIVHRLDRDTSGVLLLAKNQKTHQFLKEQFSAPALELKQKSGLADKQDRVRKTYVAIVSGWVKDDHGVINKPIGRSPSDFRRWLCGRGARGKLREAITEYKVLKRLEVEAENQEILHPRGSQPVGEGRRGKKLLDSPLVKFTYLEIHPKTGRTHQIRVHMKFLNHPVVCDSLYNPDQLSPKGITRLALHAQSIEFKNTKGKMIKVESPIPLEFKKVVK